VENLIKTLRELLGVNQADFARLLGRSWQSVQRYEQGAHPPAPVVEKLRAIAIANGHPDIAGALPGGEQPVPKRATGAPSPKSGPPRPGPERDRLHAILDEILDSGQPEAIPGVIQSLKAFAAYARVYRPPKTRGVR
jgi:transcriptional regulator with XRE-family HTH domain